MTIEYKSIRESWGSKLGFMFAAVGSAIGLANIVRFPYLVGKHGGAAFVATYIICLLVIGFPVFLTEILIGRTTHRNPCGAFQQLGNNALWKWLGLLIIGTGFIVSAFYSALAGWILGYLIEAIKGNVNNFNTTQQSISFYSGLISSPIWGVAYHGSFILLCIFTLYTGVRKGLERASKLLMPLMFLVLLYLVFTGLNLPNASKGLKFLLSPDWSLITPSVILIALGQSFFTLSAGQGTMITYGSYLNREVNLLSCCIPIVIADTLVSILAAIAVFTIVFSVNMQPDVGLGLIFHTLPVVFSKMGSGGYIIALAFFLLVSLAALTSEISAMEPFIAFLVDEKGWKRQRAVVTCGVGAFIIGIPCALSYSVFKDFTINGMFCLEIFDFITTNILIPVGGLLAVLLVGWRWGIGQALVELSFGASKIFMQSKILRIYLMICIKYLAPAIIVAICLKGLIA